MKSEVAILLATYNGARFLEEQLDSLLAQTYKSFCVFIRDDGSNDNSLAIIGDYCQRYPQKFFLLQDVVTHRGVVHSFFYLLEHVSAAYYMFCDQDDVWLPDKIEVTLNRMKDAEEHSPDMPIVVHTDLCVVDENLNVLQTSFWQAMKLNVRVLQKFNYLAVCNCVTGCTMLINQKAKNCSFPVPKECPMHDYWIALMAAKYGLIKNVPSSTILYRQHASNTVGVHDRSFRYFVGKIKNFKDLIFSQRKQIVFVKNVDYGSSLKFLFYKLMYTVIRNF